MALNALADSFLPQSEKNVGMKGLNFVVDPIFKLTEWWDFGFPLPNI